MLTDDRGVEGFEWYGAVGDLDLAEVPPAELRRLLGEARRHVWQLVQSCAEADQYEAGFESQQPHFTPCGEAAVFYLDDALTVVAALADGVAWASHNGQADQAERYRAISRSLEEES
jgi:hypothetical protein